MWKEHSSGSPCLYGDPLHPDVVLPPSPPALVARGQSCTTQGPALSSYPQTPAWLPGVSSRPVSVGTGRARIIQPIGVFAWSKQPMSWELFHVLHQEPLSQSHPPYSLSSI
ncbi:hypothetical protein DPEC_G00353980 [Dallia pectoralis]|uniref:Uncharacterized protein n=1 Tax=Dallia pectoralis TaxID=75939 RepID=A0ACC2F2T5_DALPE|nr:hypothetical protein DPEC_G00353980 [Dallia pectoralis]